jgi:hydroxymethylbilane synthase
MTATRTLRIGTRASALARAQTQVIADALVRAMGPGAGEGVQIVPIVTHGDRSTAALAQIGGTGVFTSALRDALRAGEIDVAVHSYKDLPTSDLPTSDLPTSDLPTADAEPIVVAAVPAREDPRDALVARDGLTLAQLPPGARIGTGAPRRAAQLAALGLGLQIVGIRGNVDTRLGKVGTELDAVVLALAGLRRLGRDGEVTEVLDPIQVLPAPAQGALALECRASDEAVRALLATLDDPDSRAAVAAERAVLAGLAAGCSAPVGALAVVAEGEDGPEVFLRATVTATDGSAAVRLSATGPCTEAEAVGRRLAAELLAEGAAQMMSAATLVSGPEGTAATLASGPEGTAATLASGPEGTAATLASGPEGTAATPVSGPDRESSS